MITNIMILMPCSKLICNNFDSYILMASRLKWAPQEEELLKSLGSSSQKNKWTFAADLINSQFPGFRRTPKQCREKYNNHLIFGDKSCDGSWTSVEDEILFHQYKQNGPKWKLISEKFPSKSQNTIKNRFYGNVRKVVRKLNKIAKEQISKSFKPIREKSIIKIIEPDYGCVAPIELLKQTHCLRQNLLELIKKGLQQPETAGSCCDHVVSLIKDIHSFNCKCRFFYNKKGKGDRQVKANKNLQNSMQIRDQTNPNIDEEECPNSQEQSSPSMEDEIMGDHEGDLVGFAGEKQNSEQNQINARLGKETENDEEIKFSSCASKETVNEQEELKRSQAENSNNNEKHETVESLKIFQNQLKKQQRTIGSAGFFGQFYNCLKGYLKQNDQQCYLLLVEQ